MWAHSASRRSGRWHPLADHVRATAELARQFADPFGLGDLAAALGLVHDAGKASCTWQKKLVEVADTGKAVGEDHKSLGAELLFPRVGAAALAVLGHHGGLGRVRDTKRVSRGPSDADVLERFFEVVPEAHKLRQGPQLFPETWLEDTSLADMGIRMVFSALVDADHLDTGAHFDDLPGPRVAAPSAMNELVRRFEANRAAMLDDREPSPVDSIRADLYESVVRRAAGEPGVYRLPAPTGSGKTLTSAAFALRHAAVHGKSRVIVAVPFTTITEQNAGVYRRLLGEDVVLEHHSNTDLDGNRLRLAAENWDSPFIVTTTVQLFDSLFGRMPARSRKLHRLANSVIVLDEVQALPIALLVPILDGLKVLSQHFKTTVLLASATQPAFEHLSVWKSLPVRPLVDDPVTLFDRFRRVRYEWRLSPQPSLEQVADEIVGERQALAVVNTVAHARRLYRLVAEQRAKAEVFHLSTRMCPAHRQEVLGKVKSLLDADQPVVLVSTQLIEAGVDIDFPTVFRALAPAESLQQAAGRANREGKRQERGRVVVFDAADCPVPNFYRAGVAKTMAYFGPERAAPDDTTVLAEYYQALYAGLNVDQAERGATIQESRRKLDFLAVAEGPEKDAVTGQRNRKLAFRMIDEDQVTVVVPGYRETARVLELMAQVRAGEGPLRDAFRELRTYSVSIPRVVAEDPAVAALCRPLVAGSRSIWEWVGDYDPQLGIDEGDLGKETVW
ncbi:CRISPR-associated helicase Cas3' [Amycolatopsis cynarae]|uniref:CRISPR-associated helicase Cas3 n=1 Tax=Amycolatopsis cynarae TaxID=2995223 RepID=A0ABY7AYU1_9PSEU|nr:CRISPR-associated helicase Cas3' [Amycolatopsis sp. HUAS 11-8]WAL63773.1 CRISPR-associated helicase Cas3' [Amycolatopsis sp. HUAS 11-8]